MLATAPPRVRQYGKPVNQQSRLNEGLLAWLSPTPQRRGGKTLQDYCGKSPAALTGATTVFSGRSPPGGQGGSLRTVANGDYITGSIPIAAASDLTMSVWLNVQAYNGANPGIWRSGAQAWFIFNGGLGPRIRWGGGDYLNLSSSFTGPLNEWWHLIVEVKSSSYIKWYANGVLYYDVALPVNNAAFTITTFGFQNSTSESVLAHYSDIRFHNIARGEGFAHATYQAALGGFQNERNWLARHGRIEPAAVTANSPVGTLSLLGIAPATAKSATLSPGTMTLSAGTITASKSASVSPALLALQAISPATSKAAAATPGTIDIAAQSPTASKAAGIDPGTLTLDGVAPTTALAAAAPVGTLAIAGVDPSSSKDAAVTVDTLTITGVEPATAKDVVLTSVLLVLAGVEPATSKAAAVDPGELALEGLSPATGTGGLMPAGTLELIAIAPATSKEATPEIGTLLLVGIAGNVYDQLNAIFVGGGRVSIERTGVVVIERPTGRISIEKTGCVSIERPAGRVSAERTGNVSRD